MERKGTAKPDLSVETELTFRCIGAQGDAVLSKSGPDSAWSRTLANSSAGSHTRTSSETSIYSKSLSSQPPSTLTLENIPHEDQQHARQQSAEVGASGLSKLIFEWVSGLLWVSLL
jgi:hypothetical protein